MDSRSDIDESAALHITAAALSGVQLLSEPACVWVPALLGRELGGHRGNVDLAQASLGHVFALCYQTIDELHVAPTGLELAHLELTRRLLGDVETYAFPSGVTNTWYSAEAALKEW